jgi:hypothetical protein
MVPSGCADHWWTLRCVKFRQSSSGAIRYFVKLSKKSPHSWQSYPGIALPRMSLFRCKARSKKESIEMPQLNISVVVDDARA